MWADACKGIVSTIMLMRSGSLRCVHKKYLPFRFTYTISIFSIRGMHLIEKNPSTNEVLKECANIAKEDFVRELCPKLWIEDFESSDGPITSFASTLSCSDLVVHLLFLNPSNFSCSVSSLMCWLRFVQTLSAIFGTFNQILVLYLSAIFRDIWSHHQTTYTKHKFAIKYQFYQYY